MEPFLVVLLIALVPHIRGSTCSDFGNDASACLGHTNRVGMPSCSFCYTGDSCHETGSLYNDCDDACCASRSSLSTCDFETVDDIDQATCSGTWVAKVFSPGDSPANVSHAAEVHL